MSNRKRKIPKHQPTATDEELGKLTRASEEVVKYLITGRGGDRVGDVIAGEEGSQVEGLVSATLQGIVSKGMGSKMLMPVVDGARAAVNVQGYGVMLKAFQAIHQKLDSGLLTAHEILRIIEVTGMRMAGLERVVTDLAGALGQENAARALGLTIEKTESTKLHVPPGTILTDVDKRALDKLMGGGERPSDVVMDIDVTDVE